MLGEILGAKTRGERGESQSWDAPTHMGKAWDPEEEAEGVHHPQGPVKGMGHAVPVPPSG